jgi:hypothetical protein
MGADLDLELDRDGVAPPPPPRTPDSVRKWLVGGVIALTVAGGAFARWWTMRSHDAAPAAATSAADTGAAPSPAAPAATPLPPLEAMDPFLRGLIGTLSTRPELARWLATDGLVQQMAVAIDRVSRGSSPSADLKVLAPSSAFKVEGRGFTRTIDPASYHRYDGIADTVASIDPAAAASVYRTIRPRLGEAYTGLGRTTVEVDVAVQQALEVLINTPIPAAPVRLNEGKGATWVFADPALEALDPAQKQLVRMGPENARKIIDMLKRFQQQLRQ